MEIQQETQDPECPAPQAEAKESRLNELLNDDRFNLITMDAATFKRAISQTIHLLIKSEEADRN